MTNPKTRESDVRLTTPNPLGFSYNGRIRVKETSEKTKRYFVKPKSKRAGNENNHQTQADREPADDLRRRVFLVAIPFQEYLSSVFCSPSIMQNGKAEGPWPLLKDNIHIFRYWLVCIIDDKGNDNEWPSKSEFLNADFFDCPQKPLTRTQLSGSNNMTERLPRNIIEMIEAVQELGVTKFHNGDIHQLSNALNSLWGKYYPLVWNSQQFSVRLAYLILRSDSRPEAAPALQLLLFRLSQSRDDFQGVRGIGYIGGSIGFFIATFGIGLFAVCSTACGSIVLEQRAQDEVSSRRNALEEAFPPLRDIRF